MGMPNTKSVAFKIVLYSTLCVTVVGLISNLYIYFYLQKEIIKKSDAIDTLYMDTIGNQIEQRLADAIELAAACANDTTIEKAIAYHNYSSSYTKRAMLDAQDTLNNYLRGTTISPYIHKLMVFNPQVMVHAFTLNTGRLSDPLIARQSELFATQEFGKYRYSSSITPYSGDMLTLLLPVLGKNSDCYLYMELSPAVIIDVLKPYAKTNAIFASANGRSITSSGLVYTPQELERMRSETSLTDPDGRRYKVGIRSLSSAPDFYLYNCVDISTISLDNQRMGYTLLMVLFSVFCVTIGTFVIISSYITRPIKRLIGRIKRIASNDFSYDHSIEQSNDEMGEIGRVVNEMTMSISNLLEQNAQMYEQRQRIEIALLQSQVNPHFLYNTLDSIHWMAVIHKNPGIQSITRALGNLLRNIAKGTNDRITLKEELSLLRDYVEIQIIRYMDTFEFIEQIPAELYSYRIVKLALQPLVENAIFHGIEPTGECGTITVDGREDGDDLLLSVEDNGCGIPQERLATILTGQSGNSRGSLNGIGISNVHARLQLMYGSRYGLTVESVVGKFTRVTLRIPKQQEEP